MPIYQWKHGWIPLTHAAAMSKAKGNEALASRLMSSSPAGKSLTAGSVREEPGGRFVDSHNGHGIVPKPELLASLRSRGEKIIAVSRIIDVSDESSAAWRDKAERSSVALAQGPDGLRIYGRDGQPRRAFILENRVGLIVERSGDEIRGTKIIKDQITVDYDGGIALAHPSPANALAEARRIAANPKAALDARAAERHAEWSANRPPDPMAATKKERADWAATVAENAKRPNALTARQADFIVSLAARRLSSGQSLGTTELGRMGLIVDGRIDRKKLLALDKAKASRLITSLKS